MTSSTLLRVLGDLELTRVGESVSLGGPKARTMLAMLIAQRQARVSVDRLVDALWGEAPPSSAPATVQSHVSRLRRVLAPDFGISHEPGGYRLESTGGEIDAERFEHRLAHIRASGRRDSVAALEAALELWRGPAYGEFADHVEVRADAVRLDELRLVATDHWAEAKLATGDPAAMVGDLEALIGLHPLRECYWRFLMLALYRSGRQAEALRRANELRTMLGIELGLEPSSTVRDLEARMLAEDPSLLVQAATPRATTRASTTARFVDATSFVGRDPDLTALTRALDGHSLVTITGPGGVGKTRLALRLAAQMADRFVDGVTLVEFAALRDPAGTDQVVAQALDVQQRQHRTITATIEDFLATTEILLVLDNCEHVTDALAPLVDRLRSSCPRLKMLATSRQPLGLAGEYIEVLAPLPVPPIGADRAVDVLRSEAVALLVDRAAAASPDFVLTDDNAVAVAEICRRLDGLPLALELAAARLRTMGVDALAGRLHQRIEMLGQTQRGADGRRRTINDLVKWSYDLLPPDERRVFEQLAVFAGGFDLAAAESVCSTTAGSTSVVGQIASLVDKSMIALVDPVSARYRLLEPLREFGLDHLRSRGSLNATERRHLRWFRDLAERGAAGLDGPDEAAWSVALDRDFANFRVAHRTAVERGDAASALGLVASLREFAFRRINYEITAWADVSVELAGAGEAPDFATVIAVSAYGRFVRGDMQSAIDLADRSLAVDGDSELSDSGLPERVLGNALFYLEQTDVAFGWMDRMYESACTAGNRGRIAHARYMQSVGRTSIGDEIRGAVLAGEANAAAAAAGSPTARAEADYASGLALEATDVDEALDLLQRAAVGAAAAGNRWIEAFALTEVHALQARRGEYIEALTGFGRIVDIWYRGGDWANQWLSVRRVLSVLVELGAFEAAAVLHGALTAVGAAQAMPSAPSEGRLLVAGVDRVRTELGPADFSTAVRRGASMRDSDIVAFVSQQIADLTGDVGTDTQPTRGLRPGGPCAERLPYDPTVS